MFLKNSYSILLYVCIALFSIKADAQQANKTVLTAEIEQARTKGVEFKAFNLFSITKGEKQKDLEKETMLLPETDNILRIYETSPSAVSISMQTADGKTYQLDMQRSYPLAYDANIAFIDATGRHRFGYDKGVHYQGSVKGSDRSLAAISIFANGEVMGLFANEDGNFVIGKMEDNSGRYILYNDKDFTVTPPTQCATDDASAAIPAEDGTDDGDKGTAVYECKKVRLYWEADYGLYRHKSYITADVHSYLTGLFNQVQTLYRNENIVVELKSVDIWTVPDNYDSTSSGVGLNTFKSRWNGKGNNFDGDLAMLMARDPGGNGGVAFLDVYCFRPNAYAYGDVNGSWNTVPTYSWDVMMVTHELGHNLGSPHTHWCGWNTGTGGSCGSIDNCTTQQNGSGCSTCPSTFSNSQPASAWKGTIMSYCHLVSRGIDLANGFGPQPGDLIRDNVSSGTCLKSIISAYLVTTPVCRDTGAIAVMFDTSVVPGNSHFGVNPHSFTWSSGAGNTQGIMVSVGGNYSVTIKDSNGCTLNLSAAVAQNNDDSCKLVKASVAEVERGYISLYPNPTSKAVAVKFFSNASEELQIRITDITGKTVLSESLTAKTGENNLTLSLTGMTPGMYFVNISSAATQYRGQKLVIQ